MMRDRIEVTFAGALAWSLLMISVGFLAGIFLVLTR